MTFCIANHPGYFALLALHDDLGILINGSFFDFFRLDTFGWATRQDNAEWAYEAPAAPEPLFRVDVLVPF